LLGNEPIAAIAVVGKKQGTGSASAYDPAIARFDQVAPSFGHLGAAQSARVLRSGRVRILTQQRESFLAWVWDGSHEQLLNFAGNKGRASRWGLGPAGMATAVSVITSIPTTSGPTGEKLSASSRILRACVRNERFFLVDGKNNLEYVSRS
jgi:hypothetical protein